MEPLTHLLTGACLSRAGLNRQTSLATTMLVIGAEVPDVDVLANLAGPVTGFTHHRGFTHTLVGAPVDAALALALVYGVYRLRAAVGRPATPPRWDVLFFYGWLSALVHVLLDFTTSYGVRPFAPFDSRWYSWDIVYIVEPVILVLLLAGLLIPSLFAMIQEEIGARRKGPRGRGGAIFALVALVLLWGVRDRCRQPSSWTATWRLSKSASGDGCSGARTAGSPAPRPRGLTARSAQATIKV